MCAGSALAGMWLLARSHGVIPPLVDAWGAILGNPQIDLFPLAAIHRPSSRLCICGCSLLLLPLPLLRLVSAPETSA